MSPQAMGPEAVGPEAVGPAAAGPGVAPAAVFLLAADAFAEQVTGLPKDLGGPGLGEWDLRALVGHTSRAIVTVRSYLAQPAGQVEVASAADYYRRTRELDLSPADVAERGRQAGAALGTDPGAAVRAMVEAVADDLAAADRTSVITTIVGGMRLGDYLRTRTFELVVHGLDIAGATGRPWTPPHEALTEAAVLAAQAAVLSGEGPRLLRLVTGREPGGLSVV